MVSMSEVSQPGFSVVVVVISFSFLDGVSVTSKRCTLVMTMVALGAKRQAHCRRGREVDVRTDPLSEWVTLGSEPGVAPDGLERVRALLNTDDRFHGVERMAGGPAALIAVRDALRTYLVSGDASELAPIAAANPLVVAFADGTSTLAPIAADPTVAVLLADVHRAQGSGEWARLKACANPDCQWIYYDGSRNRSGRWCSMNECGEVMKSRAYRQRTRTNTAT